MSAEQVTKTSAPTPARRISATRRSCSSDWRRSGGARPRPPRRRARAARRRPPSPSPRRARARPRPAARSARVTSKRSRARHERLRLLVLEVVQDGDAQPAHLEHVAEALGRDERRPGAAPFEHRVRRDRRRVHDAGDRRRPRRRAASSRPIEPVQDAATRSRPGWTAPCASRPSSAPSSTMSVNVPPMSMPSRYVVTQAMMSHITSPPTASSRAATRLDSRTLCSQLPT